jgi:hypothetical protein
MTFVQFASLIRKYTRSNSTTFSDADILQYANIFKDDIAGQIVDECGEDVFGMRFYRDLVVSQREYDMPDELVKIKILQAKLDGTNWEKIAETDVNTYGKTTDDATIKAQYADKAPQFELFDNSLFLFTEDDIIAVDDGLELWALIYPADFTSLSLTDDMSVPPDDYKHGFPRPFHELLARRVSIAFKSSKDRPIPLSEKEKLYEVDMEQAISSFKNRNIDRSVVPSVPENDGSSY